MSNKDSRKNSSERRADDLGPPSGWKDRRRTVERRMPQVEEVEMSETEFFSLLVANKRKTRESEAGEPECASPSPEGPKMAPA